MSALCRLEAVGIEVVTSLSLAIISVYNTMGLTLQWDGVYNSDPRAQNWWSDEGQVDCFIQKWAKSARTLDSPSLTWRSLVGVLETLELKELSQQMEEYLTAYSKYYYTIISGGYREGARGASLPPTHTQDTHKNSLDFVLLTLLALDVQTQL